MRVRDGICEALRLIVKCGDCPRRGMVSLGTATIAPRYRGYGQCEMDMLKI